jgi:hypothetical protein
MKKTNHPFFGTGTKFLIKNLALINKKCLNDAFAPRCDGRETLECKSVVFWEK